MAGKTRRNGIEQQLGELKAEINELQTIKNALQDSERRFKTIFDTSPDPISIIRLRDKQFVAANRKFAKSTGYKMDDLKGKTSLDINLWEELKSKDQFYEILNKNGFVKNFETSFKIRSGQIRTTLISSKIITLDDEPHLLSITRDITELKNVETTLRENINNFKALADNANDAICVVVGNRKITYCNEQLVKISGYHIDLLTGMNFLKLVSDDQKEKVGRQFKDRKNGKDVAAHYESFLIQKDGVLVPVEITAARTIWHSEPAVMAIIHDSKQRKETEAVLKRTNEQMEDLIRERTRELEIKTSTLEEVNTALKVLLKKRDEDRIELEEKVLYNSNELIVPFMEKLKNTALTGQQKVYLEILDSNLKDIVSPFSRKLSSKFLDFTPVEIRVANFIKLGKNTKEIADLMNVSQRTVESHRSSIRKKLGIKHRKTNLRTHLLSIQ